MASQNQRMMDAFERARADIASLADWFECELGKYDGQEITWTTVGSLEHVRQRLLETLAEFSGFPQADIESSLDEMRSA